MRLAASMDWPLRARRGKPARGPMDTARHRTAGAVRWPRIRRLVKVANTLITGLRSDSIKRDVVEMLVNLSRRIDAVCVAEGIETPEDLEECRALEIPYGQGFYLGVPAEKAASEPAREFTGRIRTAR